VALVGSKVHVTEAVALPPPGDRSPPGLIAANPVERAVLCAFVGMLAVLDPEVLVGLAGRLLHIVIAREFILGNAVEVGPLPRRHRVRVVDLRVDLTTTLQDQNLEAPLAELL